MMRRFILACLCALVLAAPASAATITVSGTIDGNTRFFRPVPDNNAPPTEIATIPGGVGFTAVSFGVTQTAQFDVVLDTDFDAFLGLYNDVFDPALPLDQAMSFGPKLLNGITLQGGRTYFAVIAGNGALDGGQFLLSVDGPGELTAFEAATFPPGLIQPLPEPATWAMMIIGFFAAGTAMRRRRSPIVRHELVKAAAIL